MTRKISATGSETHDFLKNSGTGIIIIEEDGIISLANEEFARKTGFAREQIEGKMRWMDLVHEDELERMIQFHRLRHQTPERVPPNYIFRYKKKNGRFGEALLSIMMVPKTGQSVVSLLDLTGQKQAEDALRYHRSLQQLLVQLATEFINTAPENVNFVLNQMLESIGSFTKMDRTYIFLHDYSLNSTSNTHEWCAEDISPEMDNLQHIPLHRISAIVNAHRNGDVYHIPDVADMPENDSIRRILEPQGIRSVALFPLHHEGADFGFVGFDAVKKPRHFEQTELNLLKVAAEIISNVITRQRKAQTIQQNLHEKNVLLAEIHHRVKNNMAIINSLLALQSDFFTANDHTKSILQEMQHRISSMALVHELVYKNDSVSKMNFARLLWQMVADYKNTFDEKELEIEIRADDILLNMNLSVPFSLLANELILNACKHAFNGRKSGCITVIFEKTEDGCLFAVQDDGIGMPDTSILEDPKTLGWTIIQTLTKQLDGTLHVHSGNEGLTVTGNFPLPD